MSTPQNPPNPSDIVMQLGTGCHIRIILLEFGLLVPNLADLLQDRPKPVSHLAERTSTNEDILYRVLRASARHRGLVCRNHTTHFFQHVCFGIPAHRSSEFRTEHGPVAV